jgi:hypothetical protein
VATVEADESGDETDAAADVVGTEESGVDGAQESGTDADADENGDDEKS